MIDFDEYELTKLRGEASKHIMSQKVNEYSIWNKIADNIDLELGVEE